ncbi:hypothetical protein PTTG_29227 [Puccinia triticina 1-1 BBBD Race 1]|uniref:Integrase_H2C2 domain-containing protein n=1 Tax=Puccinia triticina (isolate 1-1 / race 1 (BBBD)) TaxID=630390 RepID=A0A180G5H5_PUCT1|nr:hypothetical protein PTTG_29227 [Puccinia triticina 1-1 BBBD Race 1]
MANGRPKLPGILAYITAQVKQRLLTGYATDTSIQELQRFLCLRGTCVEIDGLLFVEDRVVIPADPTLRLQLIMAAHNKSGHLGFPETISRLRRGYFWPSIGDDVKMFVRTCPTCQRKNMQPPSATTPAPPELSTGLLLPPATSSLPSGLNNLVQRPTRFFPEQAASTPATPTSSIITPSRAPHPGPRSNPPARTLVDLPGRSSQPDLGVVGPHPRPSSSPPPIPSSPALLTSPTTSSTDHRLAPPPALDHAVGCDPSFPVQLGNRSSARPPDQAADSHAARIKHLEKVIQVLLARSESTKPLCHPNLQAELAFVAPLAGSFRYSMDRGLQPVLSRATTTSLTKDWRDRGRNGQFNPIALSTPPRTTPTAPSRLSRTRPSANFQTPSTASLQPADCCPDNKCAPDLQTLHIQDPGRHEAPQLFPSSTFFSIAARHHLQQQHHPLPFQPPTKARHTGSEF